MNTIYQNDEWHYLIIPNRQRKEYSSMIIDLGILLFTIYQSDSSLEDKTICRLLITKDYELMMTSNGKIDLLLRKSKEIFRSISYMGKNYEESIESLRDLLKDINIQNSYWKEFQQRLQTEHLTLESIYHAMRYTNPTYAYLEQKNIYNILFVYYLCSSFWPINDYTEGFLMMKNNDKTYLFFRDRMTIDEENRTLLLDQDLIYQNHRLFINIL